MYNDQPPGSSKSLNHGHTKGELKQMPVTVPNLLSVVLEAVVILDFSYSPVYLSFLISCSELSDQLLSKMYNNRNCNVIDSGDVCFDKTSGFWLVHSIPNFPPRPSFGYSYPDSGTIYGQTLLCVTYKYSEFNSIGTYCICIILLFALMKCSPCSCSDLLYVVAIYEWVD